MEGHSAEPIRTALCVPLHTAFHNTRTIRWVKTHVGWDMPIEMLKMWFKEGVVSQVTEKQIKKFIKRVNFTQRVKRQLELEEVQAQWKIMGSMCVSIWVSCAPGIIGCSK